MIKILQVLSGPYEFFDCWTLVCVVEVEGELVTEEIPFKSFNEAYDIMSQVEQSYDSEPVMIPIEDVYVPN